jgi:SAM-dependent methyltransferase
LHPQWLGNGSNVFELLDAVPSGVVLDVGCADQWPRRHLSSACHYIGLDYPRTAEWYGAKPHVFGDAHSLPLADASVDLVLALDVLEHLKNPDAAFAEAARVLKAGGQFLIQVPFLYPLHDEPHDYQRWTEHGLTALALRSQFVVERLKADERPIRSAALLLNLALSHAVSGWLESRSIALLMSPIFAALIPIANISAWVLGAITPRSRAMPISYQLLLRKTV